MGPGRSGLTPRVGKASRFGVVLRCRSSIKTASDEFSARPDGLLDCTRKLRRRAPPTRVGTEAQIGSVVGPQSEMLRFGRGER